MNLAATSDQELIKCYLEGNTYCFNVLAERYKKKIYQAILIIVKDKGHAEDLLQEVFIKIIKSFREGRYKHEDKFGPWASRVARNLCLDFLRMQKHDQVKPYAAFEEVGKMHDSVQESHEVKMISQQDYDHLYRLLNYLPLEQREVIVFRHFKDMSFKQIASITNCSINTAIGRMRYGLLNLRRLNTHRQVA